MDRPILSATSTESPEDVMRGMTKEQKEELTEKLKKLKKALSDLESKRLEVSEDLGDALLEEFSINDEPCHHDEYYEAEEYSSSTKDYFEDYLELEGYYSDHYDDRLVRSDDFYLPGGYEHYDDTDSAEELARVSILNNKLWALRDSTDLLIRMEESSSASGMDLSKGFQTVLSKLIKVVDSI